MRVLSALPQYDLTEVPAAARAAEEAGYDGLLTMENQNEPFLALAVAAVNTRRVTLGTAVAIAFPRSPMVVANASWDLQIASRGRFVLGLGPQIRAHNERRFSVPWSPPVPRLREYVQALRAIWRAWEHGGPLRFEGHHYRFTLMTPNFTPRSMGQPMVPVTIAAVGPHALRLAGEVADGVRLHGFCTRKYLDDAVLPRLQEGMGASGRKREHFEVTGGGFIATGPDAAAVAKAFEWVRYRVAFYASTPAYRPVLAPHGLEDLGAKLNTMTKAGQWDRIAAQVSDDVVHLFAAVGTHAEIAPAIARRFGGIADGIYARAAEGDAAFLPPDLVQDIRRIPSPFQGHRTSWGP
ncbi:MAG TPA: TIGR03617 family F420-dependent LLM class oxidoreductase [Verrucomicrobiae bacterium]|jgi:probable F420-dependent oxidoreductase|nr:TIGR03617 family F420-dependent LLM class oxidoreductase [Verrucomicrobiae bacterium]